MLYLLIVYGLIATVVICFSVYRIRRLKVELKKSQSEIEIVTTQMYDLLLLRLFSICDTRGDAVELKTLDYLNPTTYSGVKKKSWIIQIFSREKGLDILEKEIYIEFFPHKRTISLTIDRVPIYQNEEFFDTLPHLLFKVEERVKTLGFSAAGAST